MRIHGTVALVTGAGGGLGIEFVRGLIEFGAARVHASDLPAALDAADYSDIDAGGEIRIARIPLDVTDPDAVADLAAKATNLSLLVNNAAVCGWKGLIASPDLDAARREMEVNYWGMLNLCRAFAPILRRNGGGIVNVCAFGGLVNLPIAGSYSASKAAMHSATQGIRAELAPLGVPVAGVYPGPVDTPMLPRDIPMAMASPGEVVDRVIEALRDGQEDIFPDPWSAERAETLVRDPKKVEAELAALVPR